MTEHTKEQDSFAKLPWVEALVEGLAESDRKIRTAALKDGWQVVQHRGRVIREAMSDFYQHVVREAPPRGAFAIHALGGTGRQEICSGSDIDIGIVVENIEENEHFLRRVSQDLRLFSPFVPGLRNSVKANAFPDLRDADHFDLKSLVSLLDADLLVGDIDFDRRIRLVCQQRAAELGLEFIFAINEDLRQYDQRYPQRPGDVGGFHVKDGIGGLRNFQMTMWLYSFERWIPSAEVYEQVRSTQRFESEGAPARQVLDAVGVLFSVRCWIEQRRAEQREANDGKRRSTLFVGVDDMDAYLKRFGAEGLTELNTSRQIIRSYRHETWDRLLEYGVVVPEANGLVVWGTGGLRIGVDALFKDATETFFSIYRAQQRFDLPIDKRIKRAARKNIADSLRSDPVFVKLLGGRGSIVAALEDWFDFGVLDKLLPGFRELANKLYQPGHRTAALTRAARAIQRVRNLEVLATITPNEESSFESYFARQYDDLGDSARGALRLALLTEEIPETLYGGGADYARSVKRYVNECLMDVPGLSSPTLRTIEFLLLTKREILLSSQTSDDEQVLESWRQKIDEVKSRNAADAIRALALFSYAAFDYRKPEGIRRERLSPEEWRNVQNLTQNLLYDELDVGGLPFDEHYFDEIGQRIGNLLPRRLLASPHVDNTLKQTYEGAEYLDPQRTHRIINALKEVVQTGQAKVELRRDDAYFCLTLFAWDFPGLFWRVAGALFDLGCSIRTTDLYGIPDPDGRATDGESLIPHERRLICDVLTFNAPPDADESWEDELRRRVSQRLENPVEQIDDNTGEILAPVMDVLCPRLTDLGGGQMKFSCHSPSTHKGTQYAISRLLSERAGANVESIARDGTRDWPIPRRNFYIRVDLDVEDVAAALREDLGDVPIDIDAVS